MRGVVPSASEIRTRFSAVQLTLISEYHNAHTRVSVRCRRCRRVYTVKPYSVFEGKGCASCNRHLPAKLTQAEVRKRLHRVGVVPLEEYRGHVHRIKVRCRKCAHVWRVFPASLFQGHGCAKCAWDEDTRQRHACSHRRAYRDPTVKRRHARAMRRESVRRQLRLDNSVIAQRCRRAHIELLTKYRGRDYVATVRCCECHTTRRVVLRAALRSRSCPECYPHRFGESEAEVRRIVERVTGWRFPKARPAWLRGRRSRPLELDGYNARHQVAFEYQGRQHYEAREQFGGDAALARNQRRDQRKRDLCRYHGVQLICIPYWKQDVAAFVRAKLAARVAA